MGKDRQPKVKSLYRALRLLEEFTAENPERGITELSELSGNIKSTVHNIMQTFELCGFVSQNETTGKYRLGPKVVELAHIYYLSNNNISVIKEAMKRISQKTGETVYLATKSGGEVVYIAAEYPSHLMGSPREMGFKAPLYCTGVGKALFSYSDSGEIGAIVEKGLKQYTPNTITDKDKLMDELDITRERGYAIDNMEHEYGIRCVAVPIKDLNGEVKFSMSISGPSLRMTDDILLEYSDLLLREAERVAPLI